MVDQLFHVGEHFILGGKHVFRVGHVDRSFGQSCDDLTDDFDRLAHFLHTNEISVIGITVFSDRDIEIILFVSQVGVVLAQITRDTRSTKVGASKTVGNGVFFRNRANVTHPDHVDLVAVEQLGNLIDRCRALIEKRFQV